MSPQWSSRPNSGSISNKWIFPICSAIAVIQPALFQPAWFQSALFQPVGTVSVSVSVAALKLKLSMNKGQNSGQSLDDVLARMLRGESVNATFKNVDVYDPVTGKTERTTVPVVQEGQNLTNFQGVNQVVNHSSQPVVIESQRVGPKQDVEVDNFMMKMYNEMMSGTQVHLKEGAKDNSGYGGGHILAPGETFTCGNPTGQNDNHNGQTRIEFVNVNEMCQNINGQSVGGQNVNSKGQSVGQNANYGQVLGQLFAPNKTGKAAKKNAVSKGSSGTANGMGSSKNTNEQVNVLNFSKGAHPSENDLVALVKDIEKMHIQDKAEKIGETEQTGESEKKKKKKKRSKKKKNKGGEDKDGEKEDEQEDNGEENQERNKNDIENDINEIQYMMAESNRMLERWGQKAKQLENEELISEKVEEVLLNQSKQQLQSQQLLSLAAGRARVEKVQETVQEKPRDKSVEGAQLVEQKPEQKQPEQQKLEKIQEPEVVLTKGASLESMSAALFKGARKEKKEKQLKKQQVEDQKKKQQLEDEKNRLREEAEKVQKEKLQKEQEEQRQQEERKQQEAREKLVREQEEQRKQEGELDKQRKQRVAQEKLQRKREQERKKKEEIDKLQREQEVQREQEEQRRVRQQEEIERAQREQQLVEQKAQAERELLEKKLLEEKAQAERELLEKKLSEEKAQKERELLEKKLLEEKAQKERELLEQQKLREEREFQFLQEEQDKLQEEKNMKEVVDEDRVVNDLVVNSEIFENVKDSNSADKKDRNSASPGSNSKGSTKADESIKAPQSTTAAESSGERMEAKHDMNADAKSINNRMNVNVQSFVASVNHANVNANVNANVQSYNENLNAQSDSVMDDNSGVTPEKFREIRIQKQKESQIRERNKNNHIQMRQQKSIVQTHATQAQTMPAQTTQVQSMPVQPTQMQPIQLQTTHMQPTHTQPTQMAMQPIQLLPLPLHLMRMHPTQRSEYYRAEMRKTQEESFMKMKSERAWQEVEDELIRQCQRQMLIQSKPEYFEENNKHFTTTDRAAAKAHLEENANVNPVLMHSLMQKFAKNNHYFFNGSKMISFREQVKSDMDQVKNGLAAMGFVVVNTRDVLVVVEQSNKQGCFNSQKNYFGSPRVLAYLQRELEKHWQEQQLFASQGNHFAPQQNDFAPQQNYAVPQPNYVVPQPQYVVPQQNYFSPVSQNNPGVNSPQTSDFFPTNHDEMPTGNGDSGVMNNINNGGSGMTNSNTNAGMSSMSVQSQAFVPVSNPNSNANPQGM